MIIRGGVGLGHGVTQFLFRNWPIIVTVILVEQGLLLLSRYSDVLAMDVFSAAAVGLLATVVGIFLVFRFNEAYQRWWEARILWGALVNDSRSFAREVITLLTPERVPKLASDEEARAVQKELVYRHIAYCNALRLSLRHQENWHELTPFLSAGELEELNGYVNKPTQLDRRQADRLTSLIGTDTAQQVLLMQFDSTLNRLYDIQGGCERIKNTAFPDEVRFVSRALVWLTAVAVPVVFLNPLQSEVTALELFAVIIIVLSFMIVEQLGASLKNPFENAPNDTPMTALCRLIEIDLRQQLGETTLPPPIEPKNGVLM
ncbi:MAG: bestrophin family ion channel [Deltaproteobacteria bacterium]|nr:bestrophin family ion channel [Deltaproteobacteria bacterium]